MEWLCRRPKKYLIRKSFYLVCSFVFFSILFIVWTIGFPIPRSQVTIERPSQTDHTSFKSKPLVHSKVQNIKNKDVESYQFEKVLLPGGGESTEGDCEGLTAPKFAYVDRFQHVGSSFGKRSIYLISAYYDTRNKGSKVIVVGMAESKMDNVNTYCQLWFTGHGHVHISTVRADIRVLREGDSSSVESILILCRTSQTTVRPPYLVSVVQSEPCKKSENYLKVKRLLTRRPDRPSFALCMSPLRDIFSNVDRLLETAVLNEMFGAERIFVYNLSSTPLIAQAIRALIKEGIVTLVPWHVPKFTLKNDSANHLRPDDEMAMRHDCFFRGMGHYRHLAFSTVDEIFVPRRDRKWVDIFSRYNLTKNPPSSVIFRSVFFNQKLPSDPDVLTDPDVNEVKSSFLLKTRRFSTINAIDVKSKYMIDPQQIYVLGWQEAIEFANSPSIGIPPEEGLLHIYMDLNDALSMPTIIDQNIIRFREAIIERLQDLRRRYLQIMT